MLFKTMQYRIYNFYSGGIMAFYADLQLALASKKEKDVENIFRTELKNRYTGCNITSQYGTDGILELGNFKMLLEFKYNEYLKEKVEQCNVLAQMLYYVKKMEDMGERLPDILFVGDVNECFALHTNVLLKYMNYNIDWKIAPSDAHRKNPTLIQAMISDTDISPFVFDIDELFDFANVVKKIDDIKSGTVRKVRITRKNITTVFGEFIKRLLPKSQLSVEDKANLFMQILLDPDNHYTRKGKLLTINFGKLNMDESKFNSFFGHFDREKYTPEEKEMMVSNKDMLVDDVVRRKGGEYFTPIPFVSLAHEYISRAFGDDWKEKYIVWDPAAGVSNLTRDYKFKELYISTLEQTDIDTSNMARYNPNAIKFQFDFLNDGFSKLPDGLKKAIAQKKPIIVLMNPPYGTAANTVHNNSSKTGISNTNILHRMKSDGWGRCTENMYAQFIYRIYKLNTRTKNIQLAMFTKSSILTMEAYSEFRKHFFDTYVYDTGFAFSSKWFSDTAGTWDVLFSIFKHGKDTNDLFSADIADIDDGDITPTKKTVKMYYNPDKIQSTYIKYNKVTKTFPKMSSYAICKETDRGVDFGVNAIALLASSSNVVYNNNEGVYILTAGMTQSLGKYFVEPGNFHQCNSLFAARKLITGKYATWINDKNTYLPPDETHPKYQQFANDAIIYALFNNSSQQSSLRNVMYKNKSYDIKNEYFWLSKTKMLALSNAVGNSDIYSDAKYADERHVYNVLFSQAGIYGTLSPLAKQVLDTATALLEKTMPNRDLYNQTITGVKDQVNTWDAGYAQLKNMWNEYYPDEFKAFRTLYEQFADYLRPMIYELGFLKE